MTNGQADLSIIVEISRVFCPDTYLTPVCLDVHLVAHQNYRNYGFDRRQTILAGTLWP
jgi:hypothetical protein